MSSLKRTADGSEFDVALSSKRAALGGSVGSVSSGAHSHLLKMLCPNTAIGSIIGRGGSVINELNQKTGARIRLSQNQDFFPMTNDRVISVSGDLESIETAIGELITRIIEAPDKKTPEPDTYGNMSHNQTPPNRAMQVRILIPMGASGVMIGRQGIVIKSMSEQSNCQMQLAEMNDPYDTKERIMVINGKNGQIKDLIQGAKLAIAQLFTDTTLCNYSNVRISYGPSDPSMELGRRPGGMDQNGREVNHSMPQGMYPHTGYGQQPIIPPYGFDPRSITQPMLAQQYQQPQRFVGGHHMVYQQQQQQQQQQGQGQIRSYPNDPQGQGQGQGMKGPGQARPQHSYQSQGHQQSYQQPDFDGHQSAINDVSPPVFTSDGASVTMTLGVPDSLVGAILGRSGCVVKEIMSLSGTQIQISQKDQAADGVDNRYRQVKVVGLQNQVLVAQSMIMAKMLSQPQQHSGGR